MGGVASLSALAAGAESPARKTRFYRLDYLHLRQGSQGTRITEFLASQLPLFVRNTQAFGVFTALVAPHLPTLVVLSGFTSLEEMEAADARLRNHSGHQAALEKMEQGAEPPYDHAERVLLRATDFSPEIVATAEKPKHPRVFELRVYHSPTERQLRGVHERFAGPEIQIFQRNGIHPVLYADTMVGPEMPNLTYLTPFASLAEREKAWDAFAADPDWAKARDESIAKGGQIVAQSNIKLLRPAPFSPLQ
jgi:hypothetical protein